MSMRAEASYRLVYKTPKSAIVLCFFLGVLSGSISQKWIALGVPDWQWILMIIGPCLIADYVVRLVDIVENRIIEFSQVPETRPNRPQFPNDPNCQ